MGEGLATRLNPVTIITTDQAFGCQDGILVARIAGAFTIANLLGWVFSRHPSASVLLATHFQRTCAHEAHSDEHGGRMTQVLGLFARETSAMLPVLFVAAAIAGPIRVVVSRDLLVTLGSNPLWSVLALMALDRLHPPPPRRLLGTPLFERLLDGEKAATPAPCASPSRSPSGSPRRARPSSS